MSKANSTNNAKNYYGEVHSSNGLAVLRFERHFAHAPERVWRALLEPDELAGWFPCKIEGERALGATLRFVFADEDEPPTEGTVTAFDPPRLLEYTWEQEVLRWELYPTDEGCKLIFISNLDPRYPAVGTAAGWHVCFDVLQSQLDGVPVSWTEEERTAELRAEYAERVQP